MNTTLSATGHYKFTYARSNDLEWMLNSGGVDFQVESSFEDIPDIYGKFRFTFEKGNGAIKKDGQVAAGTSEERAEMAVSFGGQWQATKQWKLFADFGYGVSLGTLAMDGRNEELIPYKNCGGLEQLANTSKGVACIFQEISSLHVDQNLFLTAGAKYGQIRGETFFGLSLNGESYTQYLPSNLMRFGLRAGFDF
jgi:hypothetical protein